VKVPFNRKIASAKAQVKAMANPAETANVTLSRPFDEQSACGESACAANDRQGAVPSMFSGESPVD